MLLFQENSKPKRKCVENVLVFQKEPAFMTESRKIRRKATKTTIHISIHSVDVTLDWLATNGRGTRQKKTHP